MIKRDISPSPAYSASMSVALRPGEDDIRAQIGEARKWCYPGATEYLLTRHTAIIEALELSLSGLSDEDLYRVSYEFHGAEQKFLGRGDTRRAVAPGAKHEALEWVRGHIDAPVEEY